MAGKMGRPVKNKFKCRADLWDQLDNGGRGMYNRMYDVMRPTRQFLYIPSSMPPMAYSKWNEMRHLIAYEAACQAMAG